MSDVEIARDGAVARVTLNRPQLHNAFDEALIAGSPRRLRGRWARTRPCAWSC